MRTNSVNRSAKHCHFLCCGRRYDFKTMAEVDRAQKKHKKTFSHRVSQAIADSWVEQQKIVKRIGHCGTCGQDVKKSILLSKTESQNCFIFPLPMPKYTWQKKILDWRFKIKI